ncbi:putative collagen alpha-1(XXVII) chain A-like [Trypanosoma grayi]|uniref:putative collagen alpha-1(XXVII) chain A-like n=1 Tax=Trypanosoma grayi TaxID=71804 RepID=UPI0004F4ADE9|nr:putative collagen alpha-1(XXVII) chain A-like [Trypanosoma grayi]KEG09247.1 putative collagen alpha-1(XXVII) chain A-like [Trypanosoma grayi]
MLMDGNGEYDFLLTPKGSNAWGNMMLNSGSSSSIDRNDNNVTTGSGKVGSVSSMDEAVENFLAMCGATSLTPNDDSASGRRHNTAATTMTKTTTTANASNGHASLRHEAPFRGASVSLVVDDGPQDASPKVRCDALLQSKSPNTAAAMAQLEELMDYDLRATDDSAVEAVSPGAYAAFEEFLQGLAEQPALVSSPALHDPPDVASNPALHNPPDVASNPALHNPPDVASNPALHNPPDVASNPALHNPPDVASNPALHNPPDVAANPAHHKSPMAVAAAAARRRASSGLQSIMIPRAQFIREANMPLSASEAEAARAKDNKYERSNGRHVVFAPGTESPPRYRSESPSSDDGSDP